MSALSDRMATLTAMGKLQGECAAKARLYRDTAPELAERYNRASFAGIGARLAMQAAIMAEHEAGKL